MYILFSLLNLLVGLSYVAIVAHWLISVGAVRLDNPQVKQFKNFMDKTLTPLYTAIRKIVQPVNGFDFTPFVAIVLIGLAWTILSWILVILL